MKSGIETAVTVNNEERECHIFLVLIMKTFIKVVNL